MFSNGTKVLLFVIVLSLGILMMGEHWGGRPGLLVGLLFALGLNALVFFFGETRLLRSLGAQPLNGLDPWGLRASVDRFSQELRMNPPALYLMEHPSATIFGLGFAAQRACICVSTGLLAKLSSQELDAALAQQLCCLNRIDRFGFAAMSVVANTLMAMGLFLDRLWPPNVLFNRSKLNQRQQPFLTLLSPFGWLVIRLVVRKAMFYDSDAAAAELIHSRQRVGEVLWRLEGLAQTLPLLVPPCTSHFFIVHPEGHRQGNFFLRTHPTLAERLRTLMGTPTV